MGDRETRRRTRTAEEIEALLREDAPGEVREGSGRVARSVTGKLRRDAGLRRRDALRVGVMFEDDGGVPRWYLAAALIAIAALSGLMVFGPWGGSGGGSGEAPVVAEGGEASEVDEVRELIPGSASRMVVEALERPSEPLRREARALMGVGWELAERVLGGIPVELMRGEAAGGSGGSDGAT